MEPLIKQPTHLFGANADPMPNDEATPGCVLCGADHTGIVTPCYLMLRGHYTYIPALKGAVFVLDGRSEVTYLEMPSGRKALAVDVLSKQATARVVHEDCAMSAGSQLRGLYAASDDFPDELDEDEEVEEREVYDY